MQCKTKAGCKSSLTFCQISSNCSTPSATFFKHLSISPTEMKERLCVDPSSSKWSKRLYKVMMPDTNTQTKWVSVRGADARSGSMMHPMQHHFKQAQRESSYLEVFSCQPWLWLRHCPHSVCHDVSWGEQSKLCSVHRTGSHKSPLDTDLCSGRMELTWTLASWPLAHITLSHPNQSHFHICNQNQRLTVSYTV